MNYFDDVISCCSELLITLPSAKPALNYVNGRLSSASQMKFEFGYFPDNKNLSMLQSVVGEDKLSKLDLIYDKIIQDGVANRMIRHSVLENHNLVMPYKDVYGNIIAIVGRSLLNDAERHEIDIPKYKNTVFDKRSHLFGLFDAKSSIIKNNKVFIVEGQFDCISAFDKEITNVVALGSSNMTFEQFSLISRYTDNITTILDNDDAGRIGTERILKLYSKYANINIIELPKDYHDVADYLAENDAKSLFAT